MAITSMPTVHAPLRFTSFAALRRSAGWWLPLVLLLTGAAFLHGETASVASPPEADVPGSLVPPIDASAVIGAVLVVGGLLAALPFATRRFATAARGRGAIELLETRPLGGRRSLLLIQVEGRRLLLGASEHGLALVTELSSKAAPFPDALVREIENTRPVVAETPA
ncbi:MAG: hypothetical protein EXS13_06915 [Planctomycetes bacterium]|nr:hypothetical protein [Planctomycetota bacterium]